MKDKTVLKLLLIVFLITAIAGVGSYFILSSNSNKDQAVDAI